MSKKHQSQLRCLHVLRAQLCSSTSGPAPVDSLKSQTPPLPTLQQEAQLIFFVDNGKLKRCLELQPAGALLLAN